MIVVTPHITLEESELQIAHMRASGPGGQNVNKVATAVELRFDVRRSLSLPADVALRVMALAGRKITKDGVLVIQADRLRSQEQNRQDALDRLVALIREAAKPPPPKRRPTRPTKAGVERRLKAKTTRSGVKKLRGSRPPAD
jgi:ribosome-associated protein